MTDEKLTLSPPEPLRGSELGTFTHDSVVNRMPEIGRRMLAENWFPPSVAEKVNDLVDGIPNEPVRYLLDTSAPDAREWRTYVKPYEGQNWLQIPWFFAETYFYRRIMEATGYFGEIIGRSYGKGYDPFLLQKNKGFEANQETIDALCERLKAIIHGGKLDRGTFADLLRVGLWSNQADLSLWPVGSEEDPAHDSQDQNRDFILVDHSEEVVDYLISQKLPVGRVDFLIDNAGFELVVDLCITAALLELNLADAVWLHVKAHPTFVSDVIVADIGRTTNALETSGSASTAFVGEILTRNMCQGRILVGQDFFWTSPLAMWDMPDVLRQQLSGSSLIISKGDANYRRLLGDRHWPYEMPFEDIVSYMPAPLLALRALKAEVASGLAPGQAETTALLDPEWMVDGRWGVIQFRA